jgi:hypothetical protein
MTHSSCMPHTRCVTSTARCRAMNQQDSRGSTAAHRLQHNIPRSGYPQQHSDLLLTQSAVSSGRALWLDHAIPHDNMLHVRKFCMNLQCCDTHMQPDDTIWYAWRPGSSSRMQQAKHMQQQRHQQQQETPEAVCTCAFVHCLDNRQDSRYRNPSNPISIRNSMGKCSVCEYGSRNAKRQTTTHNTGHQQPCCILCTIHQQQSLTRRVAPPKHADQHTAEEGGWCFAQPDPHGTCYSTKADTQPSQCAALLSTHARRNQRLKNADQGESLHQPRQHDIHTRNVAASHTTNHCRQARFVSVSKGNALPCAACCLLLEHAPIRQIQLAAGRLSKSTEPVFPTATQTLRLL